MDWNYLQHKIPFEKNFRWRGGQVSRIEAFTDAVFALSVTLVVANTVAPGTFTELMATLKAFPAIAGCAAFLLMVWYFHFLHFRRYGLEDGRTMWLNIALLFVVLFYVYPLKLMIGFLVEWMATDRDTAMRMFGLDVGAMGTLLAVYGTGFVLMYLILALMGRHALRRRDELELNEVEVYMTRSLVNVHWIMVGVGALSVTLALLLPLEYKGMAGPVYLLLPILHPIHGYVSGRRESAIAAEMAGEPQDASAETNDAATS